MGTNHVAELIPQTQTMEYEGSPQIGASIPLSVVCKLRPQKVVGDSVLEDVNLGLCQELLGDHLPVSSVS
jgi:hypothetical protein